MKRKRRKPSLRGVRRKKPQKIASAMPRKGKDKRRDAGLVRSRINRIGGEYQRKGEHRLYPERGEGGRDPSRVQKTEGAVWLIERNKTFDSEQGRGGRWVFKRGTEFNERSHQQNEEKGTSPEFGGIEKTTRISG